MPNIIAEQCGTDTFNGTWYETTGVNGDRGRFMYNHYMYPFEKYALAGILWYQGESDYESSNAEVYAERFAALMNYVRSTHNITNKNFPVFIMELPTIYKNNYGIDNWQYMDTGKVRAAIGEIPQLLSKSYLSASSDFWSNDTYWNNLHPDIKFEQSERMARLIAAVNYGSISLDSATGPIFDSIEYGADGKSATVKFTNVAGGLSTSDGGSAVRGFVGFDPFSGEVTSLTANITAADTITVASSAALPRYIAYNAVDENFYGNQINLCNGSGNPAAAFLCDNESSGGNKTINDYPAVSIEEGVYYLKNVNSGKYLDVSANSSLNGTNIQQWEFIGGNAQKFKFVSDGNGYYTIYTGSTGFNGCVDVDYGNYENGTNIQQWAASGADNQKFGIVQVGDAYVITTKVTNGNSCLDVSDYSMDNGANVHQWFFVDSTNQMWYLEPASAELEPIVQSTGNGLDITDKSDLVSICYSVWFDGILGSGTEPVTDFNNITEVFEGKRDWGGEYSFHYWAKPAQGYYRSTDKTAARNNLQLLGDAGVDFIILDFTNMADSDYVDDMNKGEAWAYKPIQTLCETIIEMRAEGKTVPYIALWCAQTDGRFIQEIYNRFYTKEEWKDCFVYWDNKPFMIFKQGETFPHPDLFTVRYMWGLTGDHCWRFLNTNNKGTAYVNNGVTEQLSVAVASQESYMSMTDTAHGRNHGIFFYEQWTEAFNVHPKIVTLTWWNEWAAQRFIINGESHFVDNYNKDYSRDIEPMEGGHGDQYYQWMKQYIEAYKSGGECPRLVEAGY